MNVFLVYAVAKFNALSLRIDVVFKYLLWVYLCLRWCYVVLQVIIVIQNE